MENSKIELIPGGRLAFRVEGDDWRVYFARSDTMDGALFLGSIKMALVVGDPDRKEKFISVFSDFLNDASKKSGVPLVYGNPQAAPEHERGKGPIDGGEE